jgi:hypothetical protein
MNQLQSTDYLQLFEDEDSPLAKARRNRVPALPPVGPSTRLEWMDFADGGGGTLRLRESDDKGSADRDLRVLVIDGHTVAFWMSPGGAKLGWMLGAVA